MTGIGLVKAKKFVNVTEETDLMRALDKIPAYLNMRDLTVTKEYKINVLKARATFLHMVVFDPRRRKQVRLHELDEFGTEEEYISNAGEIMDDDEKALQLAIGNLNPFTMKKLDNWNPDRRERVKNEIEFKLDENNRIELISYSPNCQIKLPFKDSKWRSTRAFGIETIVSQLH